MLSSYLEAELVHWINLVQVIHDEVEQRRSDCDRAIVLSGVVYFHFINFGLQDLRTQRKRMQKHKKM